MRMCAARVAAMMLASVSVIGALAVTAPSAQAQDVVASCDASGEAHFSPGVHVVPFPQQVTLFGESEPCQNNSEFPIESATLDGSLSNVLLSCVAGFEGGGEGSGTIEWELANGFTVTSEVDMDLNFTALWTARFSGVVTDGAFDGEEFNFSMTVNPLDAVLGCVTFGVKEIDYDGTFSVG
jgi:hypothetical protein